MSWIDDFTALDEFMNQLDDQDTVTSADIKNALSLMSTMYIAFIAERDDIERTELVAKEAEILSEIQRIRHQLIGVDALGFLLGIDTADVEIFGDSVAVTASIMRLSAESGTEDELQTITGGTFGDIIYLFPAQTHAITIRHAVDNLKIHTGQDILLSDTTHFAIAVFDGASWGIEYGAANPIVYDADLYLQSEASGPDYAKLHLDDTIVHVRTDKGSVDAMLGFEAQNSADTWLDHALIKVSQTVNTESSEEADLTIQLMKGGNMTGVLTFDMSANILQPVLDATYSLGTDGYTFNEVFSQAGYFGVSRPPTPRGAVTVEDALQLYDTTSGVGLGPTVYLETNKVTNEQYYKFALEQDTAGASGDADFVFDYVDVGGAADLGILQFDVSANKINLNYQGTLAAANVWDLVSGAFQVGGSPVVTAAGGLDALGDVTITTVTDGDSLRYVSSAWVNKRMFHEAAVDPTGNDDELDGYMEGTIWVNTTSDAVFVCVNDTSPGTAIWAEIGAGAGISNVIEDVTPQLGGDLDMNSKYLTQSGEQVMKLAAQALGDGILVVETRVGGLVQIYTENAAHDIDFVSGTGTILIDGNEVVADTRSVTVNGTTDQILVSGGTQDLSANRTWTASIVSNPTIPGNERLKLPDGTTAQRPGSPDSGDLRYNNTTNKLEYFNGTIWKTVATE